MDNFELENEIELRMNPQDFSLSSSDLIDIMNQYGLNEHDVAFAYSKIVAEKREEILDTTKDVVNMFREKGNYYPSFDEFKKMFNQYDGYTFVDDNILRDMHKRETRDANQTSMFEIREMIKEQFRAMREDDDFDKEAAAITKNWGGGIKKSPDAMLSTSDFEDIVDAGAVARGEIEAEFGDDEFVPMSDDEYKTIMRDLNEDGEDGGVGPQGLFKPQDSQGNDINLKALVKNLEGTKSGRVMGLGDDGKGNLIVRVEWAWPLDMKYTAPEEMGMIPEMPSNLIVQGLNEEGRSNLRGVEVTYADGTVIPTSMAAHLSDEDINNYFTPGKLFNIGNVEDNMQAVQSVNIIRENMNKEKTCKECGGEVKGVKAGDEIIDVCEECGAQESGIKKENKMNEGYGEPRPEEIQDVIKSVEWINEKINKIHGLEIETYWEEGYEQGNSVFFIIKPFRVSDSGDQTLVDYDYELKRNTSNEFRSESKKRNIRSREGIESLKNDITLFNTMIENELNGRATWVNKMNFGGEHETKSVMKQTNEKTNDMNELNENEAIMMADQALNQAIMQFHNAGGNKEAAQKHLDGIFGMDGLGESRGLAHSVKNTGDRNVKNNPKDNSHAPVTTLPEGKTLDAKIKTLSEGTLKRKGLMNFIKEEANNFAKDIKGGNKN
jgi:ribosomal protein L37AE/L43A